MLPESPLLAAKDGGEASTNSESLGSGSRFFHAGSTEEDSAPLVHAADKLPFYGSSSVHKLSRIDAWFGAEFGVQSSESMRWALGLVRGLMIALLLVAALFKADLSFFDVSGHFVFDLKEFWRCPLHADANVYSPYMASAYALPGGQVATVVITPPCYAKPGISHWTRLVNLRTNVEYAISPGKSNRVAEAAVGMDDLTADLWTFRWSVRDPNLIDTLKEGDILSWGSLQVPVVAAPSPSSASLLSPHLAICTSVTEASQLSGVRKDFVTAWVQQHFGPINGQLYMYGPETDLQSHKATLAAHPSVMHRLQIVNTSSVRAAFDKAWLARPDLAQLPKKSEHFVQLFGFQDCLYRARAAGAPWLLQLDMDEMLDYGSYGDMAGLLAWATNAAHQAVTFGSTRHGLDVCAHQDIGLRSNLTLPALWRQHFPCRQPMPDCDSKLDPVSGFLVKAGLEAMENCLGPRGRRKYIVAASKVDSLFVHTPPTWRTHHMDDSKESVQIRHFQGLLSPSSKPCSGPMLEKGSCNASVCSASLPGAVCDA